MNELTVIHDSQDTTFRVPFGAVPGGTKVTLRLLVKARGRIDKVTLRLWKHKSGEEQIAMKPTEARTDLYEVEITTDQPMIFWYYFIIEHNGRQWYYSRSTDRYGGLGHLDEHPIHSFQLTVYHKDYKVPAWFFDSIMYQIFPDRFYNGRGGKIQGKPDKEYILHENWEEQPNYKPDPKSGKILNNDFFGGNLEGIIEKLDYLEELGVGVIYLNPIFEAYSNHKYDVGDYHRVDPMYGDLDTFHTLCREAEKRGMAILLDGVFSHTGSDSRYFNKNDSYSSVGAYQSKDSKYYPWYRFRHYPDDYECWWDVKTLPNVNELEPSYQDYIINDKESVIRYWLKQGAKGWRLDVADELPDSFLKKLRSAVKETNSEAVVIGEVWEDASNKVSYGEPREYLLGEELDTAMNYPFRDMMLQYLLGHWDADRLHRSVMTLMENYPRPAFYAAMNLLGTHDVTRILTLLAGVPPDHTLSREEQAAYTLSEDQRELGRRRLQLAVLIQMTFPGVPSIYYGDEAGMEGYRDPLNRGCYPWGREDQEMVNWFKKVIALRKDHDALRTGTYMPLLHQGDLYAFIRRIEGGRDVFGQDRKDGTIVVLINRNRHEVHSIGLDLKGFGIAQLHDVMTGNALDLGGSGFMTLSLQPLAARVFSAQ